MADLHVHGDRLEIRLTPVEKGWALRRRDLIVPRDAITSVTITKDPWIWLRGIRSLGVYVPLTLAIGAWKYHGGKDFLLVKSKSREAVVIEIQQPGTGPEVAEGFSRVLISTNVAAELVEALRG
ncbi:hypothetical protein [Gryllotalpicola sp.]|uniref:hypothetical protein n=1 Tax=Gryllotalpicola sp. TaxID=1932787 RepID=UPI0026368E57|nr:hypothetical protein [Gryllotalpicola sp.]